MEKEIKKMKEKKTEIKNNNKNLIIKIKIT